MSTITMIEVEVIAQEEKTQAIEALSIQQLELIAGGECVVNSI